MSLFGCFQAKIPAEDSPQAERAEHGAGGGGESPFIIGDGGGGAAEDGAVQSGERGSPAESPSTPGKGRTPPGEGSQSSGQLMMRTFSAPALADEGRNPLFHGCRGVDHFEKVRMVDEGTYGMVFLARDKRTSELVALKKVKMSSSSSQRDGFPITALRETNILLALNHPNVVSVREMVVGKRMDDVFMVWWAER